jgi:hypothetical protein
MHQNRTGRPEITQDTGGGSRRSKRLVRSSRAKSTTRRLRRRKKQKPGESPSTRAWPGIPSLTRTSPGPSSSTYPHRNPADDDDKDGTVLSAREPRRSRSAAVALPEASSAGEPSEKALPERSLEHPDERQVGLDTDRSFVLYPVGKAGVPRLTSAGRVLNVRSLQRRRRRRTG